MGSVEFENFMPRCDFIGFADILDDVQFGANGNEFRHFSQIAKKPLPVAGVLNPQTQDAGPYALLDNRCPQFFHRFLDPIDVRLRLLTALFADETPDAQFIFFFFFVKRPSG